MQQQVKPVTDYVAKLGEGALWDIEAALLYWVDIVARRVLVYDPNAGTNRQYDLPQQVGTVVPTERGSLLVAMESEIAELELATGRLQRLLEIEPELDRNRSNDGKCDPAGRFWVGTMSMQKEPNAGALYRIGADFRPVRMLGRVTTSNGIVWSLDHRVMYYIDTGTRCIDAFDYTRESGEIANRRTVIRVEETLGSPDGMTIDAEGMLWVALFRGGAVMRIDPLRREIIGRYEIPAKNVTSAAFGGAKLDTLFVTTASVAMTDEDHERYPLAGRLFAFSPGVAGVPSFRFRLG